MNETRSTFVESFKGICAAASAIAEEILAVSLIEVLKLIEAISINEFKVQYPLQEQSHSLTSIYSPVSLRAPPLLLTK